MVGSPIKIGMNIQASKGRTTGLGVYTANLTRSLAEESQNGFQFQFYDKQIEQDLNTFHRLLWENVELLRLARRDRIDILHAPAFAPPFSRTFKVVVTVHDLIGMFFPNQLSWPSRFYWGKWLPHCVKRASAIIAVSENTKRDLVNYLKIPEKNIHVIYPSGHESFLPTADRKEVSRMKARFRIREKYFLFVGTIEPRKNLVRVVEAFARFLKRTKQDLSYQLVVVGIKEYAHGRSFKSLVGQSAAGLEDVIYTGYVSNENLNLLYCGAEAFIFPSLYEGFGIPVLEAMACGVPVLTSNLSSIPEVAGDAALYVDPTAVEKITDGMIELVQDARLRRNLIEKGFERVKRFSWKETARQTLGVYEALL